MGQMLSREGMPKPERAPKTDMDLIRECAEHVMGSLGTGHRESVYHKAMMVRFNHMGVQYRSEVVTPVMFMGECVGIGRADLILGDTIVEIKAVSSCPKGVSGQVKKYVESMEAVCSRQCEGVVVNFNQSTGRADVRAERKLEHEQPAVKRSRFFH